jgi:Plasmid encoded RepA protein
VGSRHLFIALRVTYSSQNPGARVTDSSQGCHQFIAVPGPRVTNSSQTYVRSTTRPARRVRLVVVDDEAAGQLPLGEALERLKAAHGRRAAGPSENPSRASQPSPVDPEVITAEVSEVGYAARLFAQLSLPYRDPGAVPEWVRRNGSLELVVQPGRTIDPRGKPVRAYPYGVMPRLLVTWMATEAVRTKEPILVLGGSLSSFLQRLHLPRSAGPRGSIGRLRDQMTRLFGARVVVYGMTDHFDAMAAVALADGYQLWWSPRRPTDEPLWQSTVTLSEPFFRSVIEAPVPVDLDALAELRGSALRLDIYTWLTYRMSYLQKPTTVPWASLAFQFGGNYEQLRQFKAQFLRQLAAVQVVYPTAKVEPTAAGLVLRPSPPHVRARGLKRGSRPEPPGLSGAEPGS